VRGRRAGQRHDPGAALTRWRLVYAAAGVLLLLDVLAGVSWGARAALALLAGMLVVRIGLASIAPLRPGEKSYPPVDAIEPGGIPVYACSGCGTQLVLLRKGNDRPPRHCGEPMTLTIVEEAFDR
jgi:hypothetical protein